MKSAILLLLFLLGVVDSCSDSDDTKIKNELTGNWKLVETLADPGDGSGTFQPVESEKIIKFNADGTITVLNGALCGMFKQSDAPETGTYSTKKRTISSKECVFDIQFELSDSNLILRFTCIEACGEKYVKIE